MPSSSKKLLAIIILSLLAAAYFLPVFAAEAEPPAECWPQKICADQGGNWAQTATSAKNCPATFDGQPLGYCYAPQPKVNLQVALGDKSTILGLADYIPSIYNYLLSIVSIVAIVMIMVGGLRYLTAGGNPSAVTSAKETILGAVIGLFLTLGSYTLLQTINPALTELKLPDIKMVRQASLTGQGQCAGKERTMRSGQQCASSCECTEGSCISIEKGALEKITSAMVQGSTAVLFTWAAGGGSVAAGAKNIYIATQQAITGLTKLAIQYPKTSLIAAGAAAYNIYEVATDQNVSSGVCMVEAKNNVPAGGWCEKNEHCISGSCIVMPGVGTSLGGVAGSQGIGICSDKKTTSACNTNADCAAGLWCVDNSDGKYTKSCTDGKTESPCAGNSDCKVSGNTCQYLQSADTKRCLASVGPITINTPCTTDVSCKNAGGEWSCIKGYCSNGNDGANCDIDFGEQAGCNSGFKCAFFTQYAQAWMEFTSDKSDYEGYKAYPDWQSAVNEKTGRLTQCKSGVYPPPASTNP